MKLFYRVKQSFVKTCFKPARNYFLNEKCNIIYAKNFE